MKAGQTIALGALAGTAALWGTRAWLRSRRRIELGGRVVVVTGSTTGLGFLMAQHAAARGAIVVLDGREPDELARAEADVRARGAADVLAVHADVSDQEQAARLVGVAVERFGRIDVLINNAGTILVGPQAAHSLDDYRRLMATNFWGAVHTTAAALPHMRARRSGRIVNIVSIGGRAIMPHLSAYTASKFALTGFTRALRPELVRDGIYVTGVYPMTIRTGGHTHAWFKGDQAAEYAWFGLSDTIPGLSYSAEKTAAKVLDAACNGDPELVVPMPVQLVIALANAFSGWADEVNALIDRALPSPVNLDAPAVRGEAIEGRLPGLLNRMVPQDARPG